jgi:hypothetical protein
MKGRGKRREPEGEGALAEGGDKPEAPAIRKLGVGFWVRLSLLLALIAYGSFLALKSSQEVKRAQAARYGLVDNDGRTARVVFQDPITRRREEYILLLSNASKSEARALALLRKVDWLDGVLLYWSDYVRYPVVMEEGVKGVLFLAGSGAVIAKRSCLEGRCLVVPPFAYKGLVELKRPPGVPIGAQMEVLTYGDWLYRP